jgi:AsmA protein
MLKKLLIAVAALAVIFVIAIVALVTLFDVNKFKPQIEQYVSDNYERKLTIDGDLSLKVWPRIAIALPSTTLTDPKADTKALSLGSARIGVAVMPLLTGKVEADKVILDKLDVTLVRRKDGSLSIDDLIGADKEAKEDDAPKQTEEASDSAPALSEINIGGIELTDAKVLVRDEMAGNTIKVSGLSLKTGAISNNKLTDINLVGDVSATNPAATAKITMDGQVQFDLESTAYQVPQLSLSVKGAVDGQPIDQQVVVTGLAGGTDKVAAKMIELTSRIAQPSRKLVASIKTPMSFDIAGGVLDLAAFNGQVDIDDPAVGPETVSLPFSGDANVNTKAEKVNANLKVNAPDTVLTAKVGVTGFGKPRITFDLNADKINLDKYLPPATDGAAKKSQAPASKESTDAPIDLSFLNDLNLSGKASIGELIAQGLTLSAIKATVNAKNGRLDVAPMSLKLYGGGMNGKASVVAKGNQIGLNAKLAGVNIGPLLKDLTDDELLAGNGDVALNVNTRGATVGALTQALGGTANVALRDGAIMGINLGQKIRNAKNLLKAGGAKSEASQAGEKTDFAALSASFNIANGVATNKDLSGKSPLFRLSGDGKIDIAGGKLDYTARASVVGTSKGQGGADTSELSGVTIPVHLTGPFETPAWKINWTEIARAAVKSKLGAQLKGKLDPKKAEVKAKAKAKEAELKAQAKAKQDELNAKKDAKIDQLKDDAASKLGNKLKGLLGN